MSGLDIFVTKSYDKTPVKQGAKVKTVKKTAKKMPAFLEKKTGEKYASKAAMKKHEKSEPMSAMSKEYGKKAAAKKMAARKKGK